MERFDAHNSVVSSEKVLPSEAILEKYVRGEFSADGKTDSLEYAFQRMKSENNPQDSEWNEIISMARSENWEPLKRKLREQAVEFSDKAVGNPDDTYGRASLSFLNLADSI